MNNHSALAKAIYQNSNGFILNWPLGNPIHIGDFFIMENGRKHTVGNIYEASFELNAGDDSNDNQKFATPILDPEKEDLSHWEIFKPDPFIWQLSEGIQSNYRSSHLTEVHEKDIEAPSVNVLNTSFSKEGNFFLTANDMQYIRMPHYAQIQKEILRRLTTGKFSFNEVYMVTELALAKDYSCCIAAQENAELVLSIEDFFNGNIMEILSSETLYHVEKTQNLGFAKLREKAGPLAFKAKKLQLSDRYKEMILKEINKSSESDQHSKYLPDNELLNLSPRVEINVSNATDYFHWVDANLDDIEPAF